MSWISPKKRARNFTVSVAFCAHIDRNIENTEQFNVRKNAGLDEIRTRDLSDPGAVLYRAIEPTGSWPFCEFLNIPVVDGEDNNNNNNNKWIYERSNIWTALFKYMTFHILTWISRLCHAFYSLAQYYPPALSLECYECTNSPGVSGVSTCDSNEVTKRTCSGLENRCMTVTYNFTLLSSSQIIELKNCSSSLACDPNFPFSCKYTLARIFCFKFVSSDSSTRSLFSLCRPWAASLFYEIHGEERQEEGKTSERSWTRERDMRRCQPHITLTVTLAHLLCLRSFHEFSRKRETASSSIFFLVT